MFDFFFGQHENKIDAKGRMSIPAEFRKRLDSGDPHRETGAYPRLHLVIGGPRRAYVEGMAIDQILNIRTQIMRFRKADKRRQDLEKLYFQNAVQLAVDETGRIVVPPVIRKKLDLTDRALILGRGETFEIWKPETYEASDSALEADPEIGYDPELDASVYLESELGPE